MRIVEFTVLLVCLLSAPVLANSPEDPVVEYFDALNHKDYERAAATFDADAIGQIRQSLGYLSELTEGRQKIAYGILFGQGATADSVDRMTDTAFLAALIELTMMRDDLSGVFDAATVEPLGHVPEGDDVAHVVVRLRTAIGDVAVDQVWAFSCRRVEGTWKMMLTSNVVEMSKQFEAAYRPK